jgi:hypothetical protein
MGSKETSLDFVKVLDLDTKVIKISEKYVACYERLEVLTAVVMKVAVFCDIAPCSPYVNRRTARRYIPEDGNIYVVC